MANYLTLCQDTIGATAINNYLMSSQIYIYTIHILAAYGVSKIIKSIYGKYRYRKNCYKDIHE
jgi:hypothetical protein